MRWRILIKEFGPKVVYIKGKDNIIANALSRIDTKGNTPNHNKVYTQMCFAMRFL